MAELPMNKSATPKLAPDEIPKTEGPANGFLKKVCNNNPLTANAAPEKTAVIACGKRLCQMMISQPFFSGSPPKRILMQSVKGIFTEPIVRSNRTKTGNNEAMKMMIHHRKRYF